MIAMWYKCQGCINQCRWAAVRHLPCVFASGGGRGRARARVRIMYTHARAIAIDHRVVEFVVVVVMLFHRRGPAHAIRPLLPSLLRLLNVTCRLFTSRGYPKHVALQRFEKRWQMPSSRCVRVDRWARYQ